MEGTQNKNEKHSKCVDTNFCVLTLVWTGGLGPNRNGLELLPVLQVCDNIQADLVLFACQCFPGFEFSRKYQLKASARVDPTSYQWRLAKWSIEKIPSRERALSRRKCGREGKRLLMQNIGMRPHCCERFEGEMNLLIMHKLTKDPPPCPQDLWTRPTSDFPLQVDQPLQVLIIYAVSNRCSVFVEAHPLPCFHLNGNGCGGQVAHYRKARLPQRNIHALPFPGLASNC